MKTKTNRSNIKESNETLTSRDSRIDSRNDSNIVTLPGGRKIIRRATDILGAENLKLSVPSKAGFTRRWISDAHDHNVQYYINLGFVPACDESGAEIQPRRGGTRPDGKSYDMYLFEIPTETIEELRRKNAQENHDRLSEAQISTDEDVTVYNTDEKGQNLNSTKTIHIK